MMVSKYIARQMMCALLLLLSGALFSTFSDNDRSFAVSAQVAVVNAASYTPDNTLTPDSIAAAFGNFQTQNGQVFTATSTPLPTSLGGVSVTVNGLAAQLFFVSGAQINLLVPASVTAGIATIVVTNADTSTRTGTFTVTSSAAGVFSATSDGKGTAAALTTFDGVNFSPVTNPDGSAADVDAGTKARPNFLVLFTTGIRHTPAANPNDGNGVAEAVTVTIQGVPSAVAYAGAQGGFVGLDQINVTIPPTLSGFGTVIVQVTAGGRTSNLVTIKLGGQQAIITTSNITNGQTINGSLTIDDQVQQDTNGGNGSFFFDAFRFTATANQSVVIDLRSSQFDATILLYRVNAGGTLSFVAADDQFGALGIPRFCCQVNHDEAADDQFGALGKANGEVNNNSLLLSVLTQASDYIVFATTSDVNPNGIGNYTLTFKTGLIPAISYGSNQTSLAISNTDIQNSVGTYLDAFWFQGTQNDVVQIAMNTNDFFSFLVLIKADGDIASFDDSLDHGTGNRNSVISPSSGTPPLTSLPTTGPYIIVATPFDRNTTGAYSLALTKLSGAPAETAATAETANQEFQGRENIRNNFGRGAHFTRFAARRVVSQQP